MDLVGALNASGVPLILELPQADRGPPMFSSSALPELDNGENIIHSLIASAWTVTILRYERAGSQTSHRTNSLLMICTGMISCVSQNGTFESIIVFPLQA